MEWQLALKDAETCVAMDPKFLKGWYSIYPSP